MTTKSPDTSLQTPVAIVGAGPVGLSLALGLARHGVRSVLIERRGSTSERSKAPGIHIRTREILGQWGIEDRFLQAGQLAELIRIHAAGSKGERVLASYDLRHLADEAERPGLLILEQAKTEKLLLEAVRETAHCDIRFNCEAVGLAEQSDTVQLTVRKGAVEETIRAVFVVGCDGAGSFVRKALDLPFDGITYSLRPLLADIRVQDDRDRLPWPRLRNVRGSVTVAIRLENQLWRIIRLDRSLDEADEVSPAELRRHVADTLGEGPFETLWANRFRIHRRAAPSFRVGRTLLAGDAAHVHSPVGGQGMNAGIQDAHNLAWKLAAALAAGDAERLLDSYNIERRGVVVGSVSGYTDFLTRSFLQTPSAIRAGAFAAGRLLMTVPRLRRKMLRRMSMIDLPLPASPLLDDSWMAAGQRLPNVRLQLADASSRRLYDLLPCDATVLRMSDHYLSACEPRLPDIHLIEIGPGSWQDASRILRRLLRGPDGYLLVRPDMHIAGAFTDVEALRAAAPHALGQ